MVVQDSYYRRCNDHPSTSSGNPSSLCPCTNHVVIPSSSSSSRSRSCTTTTTSSSRALTARPQASACPPPPQFTQSNKANSRGKKALESETNKLEQILEELTAAHSDSLSRLRFLPPFLLPFLPSPFPSSPPPSFYSFALHANVRGQQPGRKRHGHGPAAYCPAARLQRGPRCGPWLDGDCG